MRIVVWGDTHGNSRFICDYLYPVVVELGRRTDAWCVLDITGAGVIHTPGALAHERVTPGQSPAGHFRHSPAGAPNGS